MKNYIINLIFIASANFLIGCEPEVVEEQNHLNSNLKLESSTLQNTDVSVTDCRTVTFEGQEAGTQFGDITYSSNHDGDYLNINTGTEEICGSRASARPYRGSEIIFDFPEGVATVSVVLSPNYSKKMTIEAFRGPKATGETLGTNILELDSNDPTRCITMSISAQTISSVRLTGDFRFGSKSQFHSISYCFASDNDRDGIHDNSDNCPYASNPDQKDFDQDNLGDICDTDDDNDGVLDSEDDVQFSNPESEVKIAACDSGVLNQQLSNGVFMSDLIDELEKGEYKNLGQTVRSFTELMNKWVNDGVISGEQKTLILNCAITENQ